MKVIEVKKLSSKILFRTAILLEKHSAILQVRSVSSTKRRNFFLSFYAAISAAPDPATELNSPKKWIPPLIRIRNYCLCVRLHNPLPVSRGEENGRGPTRPCPDLRLQVGVELQRLLHPGVASSPKFRLNKVKRPRKKGNGQIIVRPNFRRHVNVYSRNLYSFQSWFP